ncbi:hypothetical protein ATI61_108493 [Archangium gephyra]|uniref:Uncharacterized protein n=1 Tax=Archangium gephyra TaxID=48 RepID=A0AAC8Q6T9_9BACT|nr:hypothetical protein [Archangium gephyra]AKJ02120.1 Hypothetical protein AA314_03746 [Archangium gephyra]REG28950.1 hypothetical protein ATI61_108493 [Archangium gephyra]
MSSETDQNPFRRKVMTRQPGLIGAQWWNEGLSAMSDPVSRRKALQALAVFGGAVAVGGFVLAAASSGEDEYLELHDALQMQRERGWNFGATDDSLTFTGQAKIPLRPQDLNSLATELTPKQDALKPFSQATLFQSVSSSSAGSLALALRPIYTPEMDTAFKQGQALAALFAEQPEVALTTAVLVDLPGPESIAFATALAERFEPVFTFDNWPHPVGVVPAHLTLAAATYYQPTLRELANKRTLPAPPVFVLDRLRLSPYSDQEREFDNRYMARMPSAEQLRKLGIQHVLYVVPGGKKQSQELDDLNEDFVAWRTSGLDVKLVAAKDFQPDPATSTVATGTGTPDGGTPADAGTGLATASTVPSRPDAGTDAGTPAMATASTSSDGGTTGPVAAGTPSGPSHWYYGGSRMAHNSFWFIYPWGRTHTGTGMVHGRPSAGILSAKDVPQVPANVSKGYAYEPQRRTTMFSAIPRGATGAFRPFPTGFGKVAMRTSSNSRAILGPAFSSRSSWSRSSSYSSGG